MATRRPRPLHSATDVPVVLVDEIIEDMGQRLAGSPEARRCEGLSFCFTITDRSVAPALYAVGPDGHVSVRRAPGAATFTFSGPVGAYDAVLRGQESALGALLRGRIRLNGSLVRIRSLLRMMPAVNRAYVEAREQMIERHSARYDFRF